MADHESGLLDATGAPVEGEAPSSPLLDESGQPFPPRRGRAARRTDLEPVLASALRGASVAALLAGVAIGYALGALRRR